MGEGIFLSPSISSFYVCFFFAFFNIVFRKYMDFLFIRMSLDIGHVRHSGLAMIGRHVHHLGRIIPLGIV